MYYLIYPFLYLLSLLPFWVLYGLSDVLYLILGKIIKYRKDIIQENLSISFPEKTANEIQEITKKYYCHLCDSIVETIKMISISKEELARRMKCNWEVFDSMTIQNRNGQSYMSHQFNWEWATLLCNWHVPRRFTGLYMPLTNAAFERLFLNIRGRAGMKLVRVQDMQKEMTAGFHNFDTLSMGMSEDLEAAIAEGATMIRVGSAIFGQRPPSAKIEA